MWIDKSMHCDSTVVKVKEIKYKSFLTGATEEDKTTDGTSKIINAGEYTITLELADKTKYQWTDGTTTDKSFKITVDRVKPNVTIGYVKSAPAKRYITDNGGKLPDIQNVHANATPGKLEWHENQDPSTADKYYYWKFEPDDNNKVNYLTLTDKNDDTKVEINYNVAAVDKLEITVNKVKDAGGDDTTTDESIYDAFTLTDGDYSLKNYITVKAVYKDNDGTKIAIADSDYSLLVISGGSGGKLAAGSVKIQATGNSNNSSVTNKSGTADLTVLASQVVDITAVYNDNGTHLTYPVTESDLKGNLTVTANWNYSGSDYLPVDAGDVDITGTIAAGNPLTLTVEYEGKTFPIYPVVDKGAFDVSGITFTGDTVTYDESTHSIAYSGTLPEGVSVKYEYKGTKQDAPWEFTNAGTYDITLSFTHSNANYNAISTTLSATLQIDKANYPGADKIEFKGNQFYDDGAAHSIKAENVPNGVEVTYSYNGGTAQSDPIEFTGKGKYKVTAHFEFSNAADKNNYNAIDDIKDVEVEITDLLPYDMTGVTASAGSNASGDITSGFEATYDGKDIEITVDNLPDGVTVDEVVYEKYDGTSWDTVSGKPNGAGYYRAVVSFNNANADHATPQNITINLSIEKAKVDLDGVADLHPTYTVSDESRKVEVKDEDLPDGVTGVEYEYDGKTQATPFEFVEAGEYTVKVHFTYDANHDGDKYIEIVLTIDDAFVTGVSAVIEDGAKFDINGTLDDVKAKIKAEISYNNGTKESVGIEDLTVACATLREGGLLEVGKQTITVKYADGIETTVEIEVAKAKVALPVYNGSLAYTGDVLKPT
ncbi:MAG: MBG domain-containing protein, partial [Clostridia bacterium]|nr:MBG domain-containing protein [Clostridia bacterium]